MKWREIISNVAANIGDNHDATRLIRLIERADAEVYTPDDLRGVFDERLDRVPFLDALVSALQSNHDAWPPELLAQARAVLRVLPLLLQDLRSIRAGYPARIETVVRELTAMEEASNIREPLKPGRPHCPRCGSQRLDTRKTTAFGTNLYERLCLACGDMQEWEDGISLGAAMSSEEFKD